MKSTVEYLIRIKNIAGTNLITHFATVITELNTTANAQKTLKGSNPTHPLANYWKNTSKPHQTYPRNTGKEVSST